MKNTLRFENKVAIVTGADGGIGKATALALAAGGARVVLAARNKQKLEAAEKEIVAAGAPMTWVSVCDLTKPEQISATVAGTLERFGQIDLIINNAGQMIFKSIEEHTPEDWNSTLAADLLGTFYFIQQGFLHMKNGGSIVNVSSVHAVETTPNVTAYAASKAAVLSLTRSAAIEGKEKNIRVNAVLPGAIDTPMLWDNPNVKNGKEKVDPSDVGQPQDVASMIAYLCTDEAKFVQGASIRVDGGRLARL